MLVLGAVLALAVWQDAPAAVVEEPRRPEPPITAEQAEEDARYRVTEGDRSGDGATPDRYVCELRRIQGSNFRQRRCSTVEERRRVRELAREVVPGGAGGTAVN